MVDHDGMSSVWRQNQILTNRVLALEAQIKAEQRKVIEMRYVLAKVMGHWSNLIDEANERGSADGH